MLDMVSRSVRLFTFYAKLIQLSAFAHLVTINEYVRPRISDTLGLKSARHPIREKVMQTKFIPNDVYATQQSRFQIITGCNMSGTFVHYGPSGKLCSCQQCIISHHT